MTHTSTPWKVILPKSGHPDVRVIADAVGNRICRLAGYDSVGDAQFIVAAVNSHDVMLEALEAIIEFDNENVLVVEGKAAKSEEDKALNKILVMVANARDKAKP